MYCDKKYKQKRGLHEHVMFVHKVDDNGNDIPGAASTPAAAGRAPSPAKTAAKPASIAKFSPKSSIYVKVCLGIAKVRYRKSRRLACMW